MKTVTVEALAASLRSALRPWGYRVHRRGSTLAVRKRYALQVLCFLLAACVLASFALTVVARVPGGNPLTAYAVAVAATAVAVLCLLGALRPSVAVSFRYDGSDLTISHRHGAELDEDVCRIRRIAERQFGRSINRRRHSSWFERF